jgi:hypothetical protein
MSANRTWRDLSALCGRTRGRQGVRLNGQRAGNQHQSGGDDAGNQGPRYQIDTNHDFDDSKLSSHVAKGKR